MTRDATSANGVLFESDAETPDLALAKDPVQVVGNEKWDAKYDWNTVIFFPSLFLAGLYGGYMFLVSAKWQTDVFAFFLLWATMLGVTAGAHRLWSHKAYKAKWPLQLILMVFHTLSLQYSVINWVRDHRMHHKYSGTDGDPQNATRGFFFSHIGWLLLLDKHPEFKRNVQGLDISDVETNPILRFQRKYFVILSSLFSAILPTVIPVFFWDETWTNAFLVTVCFRLTLSYNFTMLVNSAAHMWGYKPYDKNLAASESVQLNIVTFGEGSHNYHHAFPWDYKAAEIYVINLNAAFIDFFARIGWAYDLKTVPEEIIQKRVVRTGDGSHHLWGWGDKDQSHEEMKAAIIIYPKVE